MSKRGATTVIPGCGVGAAAVVEPSPKKGKKQSVEVAVIMSPKYPIPRITVLFGTDMLPIGWIFAGFYNGRSYLKKLSNRNNSTTCIGTHEFRPFTNLTTKWVPKSMVGENLWAIKISIIDRQGGSFPREPVGVAVAWANKIARALLDSKVFSKIELKQRTLTDTEEVDFLAQCASVSYGEAVDAISMEAIAPGEFEHLI